MNGSQLIKQRKHNLRYTSTPHLSRSHAARIDWRLPPLANAGSPRENLEPFSDTHRAHFFHKLNTFRKPFSQDQSYLGLVVEALFHFTPALLRTPDQNVVSAQEWGRLCMFCGLPADGDASAWKLSGGETKAHSFCYKHKALETQYRLITVITTPC